MEEQGRAESSVKSERRKQGNEKKWDGFRLLSLKQSRLRN